MKDDETREGKGQRRKRQRAKGGKEGRRNERGRGEGRKELKELEGRKG